MPKVAALQPSFNGGEFSPLIFGRVDSDRYKTGLATCLNYIPTLQGPAVRRPGTKFVTTAKVTGLGGPALIPFQFSQTQAYMLEFGSQYIRFYQNGGQIITSGTLFAVQGVDTQFGTSKFWATRLNGNPGLNETIATGGGGVVAITAGSILEVPTPYAGTDVAQIRWAQNGDTLYLTHPNYPPYKLQRAGSLQWTMKQVSFKDGPYLPLNSYATIADSANIQLVPGSTGRTITLSTGPQNTVSTVTSGTGGQIRVTTTAAHGHLDGDKVFIQGVTGTTEANNVNNAPWSITIISTTAFELVGTTFVHTYVSGGVVNPYLFQPNSTNTAFVDAGRSIRLQSGTQAYWGVIFNVSNPATAVIQLSLATPLLPGTTAITFWNLGAWQTGLTTLTNNYPAAVSFHQNRLFFAGAPQQPQELDGSVSGDYENFQPNNPATIQVRDTDALQFTFNSSDLNQIRWLKSEAQGLLGGTLSSEWLVQPSNQSQVLTPTNFNAVQTSYFGSSNADAVQAGNAVLHIQRAQRKLRELNYFFQVGTFRSTDLTEISEHLTQPTITKLCVVKETQPILWAIRTDGILLSMVYNRDDQTLKAGWARHQLGGQSDSAGTNPVVTSIGSIPAPDGTFDQLWLVVTRYINGATIQSIEYMTKIYDETFTQNDSYHFDCGSTFYAPIAPQVLSVTTGATTTIGAFTPGHGFSNGDVVRFDGFVGLNISTTDINGNVTISNLVNGKEFVVASVTTNTFVLNDFAGNAIVSTGYSAFIATSTAKIAKLISTISGLTWLLNETVSLLCDGAISPNVVVSNSGSITLPFPAAKVQIGYDYNSDMQTLRLEAGAADGTSMGKTRRPARVALIVRYVGIMFLGTRFSNLIPVIIPRADNSNFDQALGTIFSGIIREGLESTYNTEGQICVRQNQGLPGYIQAITSFMEEFDV